MKFGLDDLIDPRLWRLVPQSRAFYAERGAGRGPSCPDEVRTIRALAATPAASDPPAVVEIVGLGAHSVPVRLHAPTSCAAAGVLLEIHGGGFYLGSAAESDLRNRALADAVGLAVVSVDYRLAPEHPWPAAADDCEIAARWLTDHAQDRFGTRTSSSGASQPGQPWR